MINHQDYFTYLMSNQVISVLYTGSSNNLIRRVWQHKHGLIEGFTSKYNVDKLLYYERCLTREEAYKREKEIKGWTRKKKLNLIQKMNPELKDLSEDWWRNKL